MRKATERTDLRFSRGAGTRRSWTVAAAVATTLVLWHPQPSQAQVHPFYREALQAGASAYARAEFAAAAQSLRIASFGMLDEPTLLAEALTRLGLAQAAAGRQEEFLATFDRIGRIEERFNAYSDSSLPAALRDQYEEQVTRLVPASTLASSTPFARLYRQQELLRLERMLPAERAAALEAIVASHPDDFGWQMMLATSRVESGSGADAIAALEGMVADRPGSQHLACLLGRGYLQSGSCEVILQAPLETVHQCDVRTLPTAELVQYLECLSAQERWLEAASILTSLAPERRAVRPFPSWEKRVAKRLEPDTEIQKLPPYVAERKSVTPAEPAVAPAHQEIPVAKLESLRLQLGEARTASELQAIAEAAEDLKRAHPGASAELLYIAGEAAYRASKWQLAADYLRAAGGPPDDRSDLLFYLSVSLHEVGDQSGARETLLRALPGLEQTQLVERYRREILDSTQ